MTEDPTYPFYVVHVSVATLPSKVLEVIIIIINWKTTILVKCPSHVPGVIGLFLFHLCHDPELTLYFHKLQTIYLCSKLVLVSLEVLLRILHLTNFRADINNKTLC